MKDSFGLLAADIETSLQDDMVLSQRSRLVRAQNIHRAEILDRIEPLHDDLFARHGHRTLCEINRHDHGQHFRGKTDGDRYGEEQRFQPIVLSKTVDQEYGRHHYENETDHQPGEPIDAVVESRGNVSSRYIFGKLTKKRICPGPKD